MNNGIKEDIRTLEIFCFDSIQIKDRTTFIYLVVRRAHVSQNTGNNEWYTPSEIIEAARSVLGVIDVDPASTKKVNKVVKAKIFYTKETDGLTKKWKGNVWMNPPYARLLVRQFMATIVHKIESGEVTQAIVLVNNATETEWFKKLADICSVVCFPTGRIKFIDPDGNPSGHPLQGQAILYFGNNKVGFNKHFAEFGLLLWK